MNNTTKHTPHSIPELDLIDLDREPIEHLADDFREQELTEPRYYEEENEESFSARLLVWLKNNKWHIGFGVAVVLILAIAWIRIMNYGVRDDLNNYEGNYDLENYDNILPLFAGDDVVVNDDGVTTIVAFGNAPFADDRDSEDSLANIIAEETGATVYNLAFDNSYMRSLTYYLRPEEDPMIGFSFYWLTTAFCLRYESVLDAYNQLFEQRSADLPAGTETIFRHMMAIDFNKVDVITIMYDATDYLMGSPIFNGDNPTDINTFTGNMEAGIELIQQTYPHIRIIVLTPTYAHALDENGNYVSSNIYKYGNQDVLASYVLKQVESCYHRQVSVVDNFYGTIYEEIADKYLIDHLHLNVDGRRLVAQRFIDALTYYDK